MNRIIIGIKAIKELGFSKIFWFILYKALIKTGYFHFRCPINPSTHPQLSSIKDTQPDLERLPFTIPTKENLTKTLGAKEELLIQTADQICAGRWQFFGGDWSSLEFKSYQSAPHWSDIRDDPHGDLDLKYIWEPARFCWVYPLGRAYLISGNQKYVETFINNFLEFINKNPVNQGLNWISAQEVSLRIIAFCYAYKIFESSDVFTPEIKVRMLSEINTHAHRIPPTLSYAKAQNNNHLLSEAIGLMLAGTILRNNPGSSKTMDLGWKLFNFGIDKQISDDGTYVQQSTNYHRMMLQLSLLAYRLGLINGYALPERTSKKLKLATQWLQGMMDGSSGDVPNLGHNDGSDILPLAQSDYRDYRPIIQAASLAFLGRPALKPGYWDELCTWLGLDYSPEDAGKNDFLGNDKIPPLIGRVGIKDSWGILRSVQFTDRPAHADQLHVDLWWEGMNIALDPGTYRYTAPPPWNNSLAATGVHNTISFNHQDQMIKAGRFLWVDWLNSTWIDPMSKQNSITAEANGYREIGLVHRRSLHFLDPRNWLIEDSINPTSTNINDVHASLHWLLPDGDWDTGFSSLYLNLIGIKITVSIDIIDKVTPLEGIHKSLQVIRAGEVVFGPNQSLPEFGWFSPTYGNKIPAISFRMNIQAKPPFVINTRWNIEYTGSP